MQELPAASIQQRHVRQVHLPVLIQRGLLSCLSLGLGLAEERGLKTKAPTTRSVQMPGDIPPLDLELRMAAMIPRKLKHPPRLRQGKALRRFQQRLLSSQRTRQKAGGPKPKHRSHSHFKFESCSLNFGF